MESKTYKYYEQFHENHQQETVSADELENLYAKRNKGKKLNVCDDSELATQNNKSLNNSISASIICNAFNMNATIQSN